MGLILELLDRPLYIGRPPPAPHCLTLRPTNRDLPLGYFNYHWKQQERRERLYREHLRWALIARSTPRRDGRFDGAQLLRYILAMNQPLYDANVAFNSDLNH